MIVMDRGWPGIPSAHDLEALRNISKQEFYSKLAGYGIPAKRLDLLYKIVSSRVKCELYKKIDCSRFALSLLDRDNVDAYMCGNHDCSVSDFFEYDPVKNGANIIKHGLSFGEVISYSRKFGALSVICPHPQDVFRTVVFSDLDAGEDGENLSFPISKASGVIFTMSIGRNVNGRFRFISSRQLSRKSYHKDMLQAFKGILDDNPSEKEKFVSDCVVIIKQHLFS
ncbi:hypothetical protein [Pseudomonas putida]|uniref:hypothetical protein n=1 Tax=Pseudomonas putida TaxID=303 RepID=UPI0012BC55E5|nr:hypothetical protein [Pseudomonas putida]